MKCIIAPCDIQLTDSENPSAQGWGGERGVDSDPRERGRGVRIALRANSMTELPEQVTTLRWKLSSPSRTSRGCFELQSLGCSGKQSPLTALNSLLGKTSEKVGILMAVIAKASMSEESSALASGGLTHWRQACL